jgi:DNA-binding protein HU-beta
MNKQELIDAVAERAAVSKGVAKDVLDSILHEVQDALAHGQEVLLVGFGTFKTTARPARVGRNPQTGAPLQIVAATVPKFSPGTAFKAAVNR